ncbi:MAG: SMP-30/gluconolactonase/LRE family protein, partial [Oxalobacteraceae bacterium]|nr:SMP-30/gluconolactonase/LRE family protein [Oxalobacteraceae bacterium]
MIDDDKATLVLNWRPSQRYPDPLIRVIDETFNALRLPLSKVEQI